MITDLCGGCAKCCLYIPPNYYCVWTTIICSIGIPLLTYKLIKLKRGKEE